MAEDKRYCFAEDYPKQLDTVQWKIRRQEILKRDGYKCQKCGRIESPEMRLNVHHKRYFLEKKAWEYEDDDLITLCEECHRKEHEAKTMPVYTLRFDKKVLVKLVRCEWCKGMGYIPRFMHVQNGICFDCYGKRYFYEEQ